MSHEYQHQPRRGRTGDQYGETGQPGAKEAGGRRMGGGRMMDDRQMGMSGGQTAGSRRMGQSPQMGGQMSGQSHERRARSFDDHLTNELRIALEDFDETAHVAAWCAKECAADGPQLGTCARICQDIAEIAELNGKLIARDSTFGPEVANLFLRIATEGLPELREHQQRHPHVAETVATIERTMNSCRTVLEMVGQGGAQRPGRQSGRYSSH